MVPLKRWALIAAALLGACATPSPDKFVNSAHHAASRGAAALKVGADTGGEACVSQPQPDGGAFVYCGASEVPSGRVVPGGAATPAEVSDLATSSQWRTGLDHRVACGTPTPARLVGDQTGVVMECTRRIGGWPHVAFVTVEGGRAWFADGLLPAQPPLERAVAIASGRMTAEAAAASATSQAITARRLAGQAFSTGDVGQFDDLMRVGNDANLSQDFAGAERDFRAAAEVQARHLGRNAPDLALPVMSQALAMSNLGRYAEAEAAFATAGRMVADRTIADPTLAARLHHYRGIDLLNQGKSDAALTELKAAQDGYRAFLPPTLLSGNANARTRENALIQDVADQIAASTASNNQQARIAAASYVETLRYEAVALRHLGRAAEGEQVSREAQALADLRFDGRADLTARLYRTAGMLDTEQGHRSRAIDHLATAAADFVRYQPGGLPLAQTQLLQAGLLVEDGRASDALEPCRSAVRILRALSRGVSETLIAPCLDAYASRASGDAALLAEMFEAAQLGQSTLTRQQIAVAAASLQEKARDPRIADTLRERDLRAAEEQAAERALAAAEGSAAGGGAQARDMPADVLDALDRKRRETREAAAEAEIAVRAAAPNLGQLVQEVVAAKDVFAALRAGETYALISLPEKDGYLFLLHDDRIALSRIDGGAPRVAALVKRARASLEVDTGKPPSFDTAAATELYDAVFGRQAAVMEQTTALVATPSGALLAYPFAALLTGAADPTALDQAPWLVRRMSVAHVPAAANFVSLRKVAGTSHARAPWFGFGDFTPPSLAQARAAFPSATCGDSARLLASLAPLPGTRAELEAMRTLLHAGANDAVFGQAFTTDAVRRAPLKDYRIVHFAAHGLLPTDLRCQTEPAIVASVPSGGANARAGLLTASDLEGLQLDADAVILSACNSGGANGAAAESLSSLARSFFYAGARALLVTHWDASDVYLPYLLAGTMQRLTEHPEQGLAGALAEAQRRNIAAATGDKGALAHPYYWAVLALIGDGGVSVATPTRQAAAAP